MQTRPRDEFDKERNQCYFSMKAHIGVDADSGLVHSLIFSQTKVPDNKVLKDLLHGEEKSVHGDKAYTTNEHNLLASDPEKGPIWCMSFKKLPGEALPEWKRKVNRKLASLRAIFKFPFRIIKRQFGYTKGRYRGLLKKGQALITKFVLANLY